MNVLAYLIPLSLVLGIVGLMAFLWCMRSGQFEDLDGAAERVLFDDDGPAAPQRPERVRSRYDVGDL